MQQHTRLMVLAACPASPAEAAPSGTAAWNEAVAAFEAAELAHDQASEALNYREISRDTLAAYFVARERLFATPASTPAQLAYKIASHDEAPDFRKPGMIEHTEQGHDANDKAWLALYRDALALASPTRDSVAAAYFAAKAELERAGQALDDTWDDDGEAAPVRKHGVTEEQQRAASLANCEAQHRFLETPAPNLREAAFKAGLLFNGFLGSGADPRDEGGVEWLQTQGNITDGFMASLYADLVRLSAPAPLTSERI